MELRVKPYAERLQEARRTLDLTQVELAARLGVSPRTVQNWETTDRMPRAKHRRLLNTFLDEVEAA